MSALDTLTAAPFTPPTEGGSSATTLTSVTAQPYQPTASTLSSLTQKPFTPTIPVAPVVTPNQNTDSSGKPYFQSTLPDKSFVGISNKLDTSGKPFFAYRTPGATATTTDLTRVATTFDPRVPQKLDPSMVHNGRMAENISQPIRAQLGAKYSDELDHSIALELSGSNNRENLRVEPGRGGVPGSAPGESADFDTEENQLAQQVVSGKMSLWEAQTKLATDKSAGGDNNPIPWTDQPPVQTISDNSKLGVLANTVTGIPAAAKKVGTYIYDQGMGILGIPTEEANNPKFLTKQLAPEVVPSVEKLGAQIMQHPVVSAAQIGQGTALGALDFVANAIINYVPGLVPDKEKADTVAAMHDTLQSALFPEGQNSIGQGFEQSGQSAIPIAVSGGAGEVAAPLGAGGEFLAGAGGFAATGQTQLPSDATIQERAQNVMDSFVQQGLFTAGSAAYHLTKGIVTQGAINAYHAAAANLPHSLAEAQKGFVKNPFAAGEDGAKESIPAQQVETPKESVNPTTPKTPEEAAQKYHDEVIAPEVSKGGPTVISADGMKDHFGQDYNDKNHPIYSKASFQLFEKALKENPGDVILTGGGPASAKSEVIVNGLRDKGFNGIVYDSNLSNYDGAVRSIEAARAAGKHVEVMGITPDLETARRFSILRENETGRGISDATFARGHAGFPDVVSKLLENRVLKESEVHIYDTRSSPSLKDIKNQFKVDARVKHPYVHLQGVRYNEADVRATYAKERFDQGTGERLSQEPANGRTPRKTPNKSRANPRPSNDGRGDVGVHERYGTEDPAQVKKQIDDLAIQVGIEKEQLDLNPARELMKYYGRNDPKHSNLESIYAKNVGTEAKSGRLDSLVTEMGFKDVQDAHEGVLKYLDQKDAYLARANELKDLKAQYKNLPERGASQRPNRKGQTTIEPKPIVKTPESQMIKNLHMPGKFYEAASEAGRTLNDLSSAPTHLSREDIGAAIQRQKDLQEKSDKKKDAINISRAQWPVTRTLGQKMLDALYPIKRLPSDVKDMATQWRRSLLSAAEEGNKEMAKVPKDLDHDMPPDEAVQAYTAIQMGAYSPVKDIFDKLYHYAQTKGLDFAYRGDYLPQVYKESLKEVKAALVQYMRDKGVDPDTAEGYVQGVAQLTDGVAAKLKIHPSFEESKVFPTYSAAAKYGLTPRFTNFAKLVGNYRYELERSAANKAFIDNLQQNGKLLPGDLAPNHWEHVTGNFLRGDYYAEPQVAQLINGLYQDPTMYQQIIAPVRWLNHTWQKIMLSGAVPYTNVHFWSIGNLIKSWTAGRFQDTIPFIRSNSLQANARWFKQNQMYADMAARQGIDLGSRMGSIKKIFTETGKEKGWMNKLGTNFDAAFTDKSFATFMPEVYLQTFKDAYHKGLGGGMDVDKAEQFAGEVTRNFFGLLGTEGRGKAVSDSLSSLLFAPQFREGVLGVLANTGKSVTTELTNPSFYLNRRLFGGMVMTYAMYNVLNKMLNNQYLWDNPSGHEFELRIPTSDGNNVFIPWMPSFLALPRSIATAGIAAATGDIATAEQQTANLFSPMIQTGVQVLANKNYFGNPIYKPTDTPLEKAQKIGSYVGLQSSHPYVKAIVDMIQKHIPLYQALSEATTLPFKFSTNVNLASNAFYNSVTDQTSLNAQASKNIAPIYEQVQQLAAAGQADQAHAIVDKLSDADYKAYTNYKRAQEAKNTTKSEAALYPTYKEIQDLINQGETDKAQTKLDGLSDSEYKDYQLLKKRFATQSQ